MSVPSCAKAQSKIYNITVLLLKTISIFFLILLMFICYWKSSTFFKACCSQSYHLESASDISVFIDAAEQSVTGISQMHFQVSVPERSVLNLKAWMYQGNWECISGFLCILPVGFFEGWKGTASVWFRSVLLALLFILITSTGIYNFVVFIDLIE